MEVQQLFDLCDQDKKGYLTFKDLKAICPQLDDDEIDFIVLTLDSDGSGKIDRHEFLGGFQNALRDGEHNGFPGIRRRASIIEIGSKSSIDELSTDEFNVNNNDRRSLCKMTTEEVYHSESEATFDASINLPCQDEVLKLYEHLQSAGMPTVLNDFERIIGTFCKEIKEQKDQNLRLQHVFQSERESYDRRISEFESEIDQQIVQTELKIRQEERSKLMQEKEDMRMRWEAEMSELKANMARLQQLEDVSKMKSSEMSGEAKEKLQFFMRENENLRTKLAESNVELAIMKSELTTMRSDYEAKKEEMLTDSEAIAETIRRSENLQRQMKLLYDANKMLHDTNDSLREALDQKSWGFAEATGPPERTFRVVMCGDAGVGKSSLVTRIIRGTFSGNLPSTLGVDFHVKTTNVDGKNVAVQLWDTAGQERFRSLCKSYFRRADGAILVYDCTVESTFLNVRDWIEMIKDSTLRQIPLMICGNKIDLRNPAFSECVSQDDGKSLAGSLGALFMECSALDGTNVESSLLSLTRELMATEDVEVRGAGVVVIPRASKTTSCCSRK